MVSSNFGFSSNNLLFILLLSSASLSIFNNYSLKNVLYSLKVSKLGIKNWENLIGVKF